MEFNFKAAIVIILLIGYSAFSQEQQDSIKTAEISVPIYPRIKLLTISYDQAGKTEYKVKNTGHPDNEGTITRGRFQAMVTLPLWEKKGFTLSATELYTREEQAINETVNPLFTDTDRIHHFDNFTTTLNGTYFAKLFGKPFLANASIIVKSTNFINPEKVSGLFTGILIFQKKPQTRFTAGIAALIDPSAQIPAFPIFTYWHRFKDPRWEIDAIMPSMIKIRRSHVFGGWLSAGTEFNGFGYFMSNSPYSDRTMQNNYNELSFSLSYERILAKNFMISVQGGYRTTLQNRIFEVNKPSRNADIEIDIDDAPFVKVGLSYIIPNEKVKKEVQKRLD